MVAITASRVLLGDGILIDGAVEVDSGRITGVGPATGAIDHDTLVPGLIDLQVNGHGDVDVANAADGDWERLDQILLSQGVTAWCPTLVTAPLDAYSDRLKRIGEAARRPGSHPEILGAHLEGPFLGDKPGAHRQDLIRPVDQTWLNSLPEPVALLTVGAESEAFADVMAWARLRSVVVSVGHSGASAAEARYAFGLGASMVTHLFNAMSGLDHRSPGVATAALLDDDVTTGLIADGVHVDPELVRLAFRVKGPDRIALVTDAVAWRASTSPAATFDPILEGAVPRLADGTIAGSALRLDQAIANVVSWGATDLAGAVQAASTTPANVIGRHDIGRIEPGASADLAALGPDGTCTATWLAGELAWSV